MTEDERGLVFVRGTIAGLPDADQEQVKAAAAEIRTLLAGRGGHGTMALALVAAEIQAKASE